jgi:hypothetical protein
MLTRHFTHLLRHFIVPFCFHYTDSYNLCAPCCVLHVPNLDELPRDAQLLRRRAKQRLVLVDLSGLVPVGQQRGVVSATSPVAVGEQRVIYIRYNYRVSAHTHQGHCLSSRYRVK